MPGMRMLSRMVFSSGEEDPRRSSTAEVMVCSGHRSWLVNASCAAMVGLAKSVSCSCCSSIRAFSPDQVNPFSCFFLRLRLEMIILRGRKEAKDILTATFRILKERDSCQIGESDLLVQSEIQTRLCR